MKRYVVIGNGVAAAGCIEGIRAVDGKGSITVISEESHPVYCRPLISYYLEGKTELGKIGYRENGFYEKNGVKVIYGKKAVKIDADAHTVLTDEGKTIKYDSMCVATGSSPFLPKFEGIESVPKRFSFMTLDDALALDEAVTRESKVLIVGAGLIGLKCAEGLNGRVASITVCDLADRILSSIFDVETAAVMQKHIEKNGISFMLSDTVERFDGGRAYMKSGAIVDFDILVTAVGVRANTSLVSEAGGTVGRGISVEDDMKTSLPDIYAAGDCTEGMDISLGKKRVLALLPNAYMQGKCAGENMAGGSARYSNAIPMNSIGFFGLHAMTAGSYFPDDQECAVYKYGGDGYIKKFFVKNGVLCGYILIGDVDKAGIYTSLIRERTPVDSVDLKLLMEHPTFSAFSQSTRRKNFGGVI